MDTHAHTPRATQPTSFSLRFPGVIIIRRRIRRGENFFFEMKSRETIPLHPTDFSLVFCKISLYAIAVCTVGRGGLV